MAILYVTLKLFDVFQKGAESQMILFMLEL